MHLTKQCFAEFFINIDLLHLRIDLEKITMGYLDGNNKE